MTDPLHCGDRIHPTLSSRADSHIGDKCYRDVGIQTNDRSLCEKIIEDQARQKCFDNTS
jgi:hypothetical protein